MTVKFYKSYSSFEEKILNFQAFRILLRVRSDFDFKFLLVTICNLNIKVIWGIKNRKQVFMGRKYGTY